MVISTKKEPTAIVYTEEQQSAINKIVNFISNNEGREIRLVGSAGTGKSTILREIISQLESLAIPITVVAPTHKACKVAKAIINKDKDIFDNVYTPITLAKALGKVPVVKIEDGEQIFVDKEFVEFDLSGIIIVDEASMISLEDLEKLQIKVGNKGIIL